MPPYELFSNYQLLKMIDEHQCHLVEDAESTTSCDCQIVADLLEQRAVYDPESFSPSRIIQNLNKEYAKPK